MVVRKNMVDVYGKWKYGILKSSYLGREMEYTNQMLRVNITSINTIYTHIHNNGNFIKLKKVEQHVWESS